MDTIFIQKIVKDGVFFMELKDSETFKNLHAAWAGETQARAKYDYFAKKAKKQGLEPIAKVFELTAKNEHAHGKIWFEMIMNGIGETNENLQNGIDGEHYEWTEMYKNFAAKAREEGFNLIAEKFEAVAKIESMHEQRYKMMLDQLNSDKVYKRDEQTVWICSNCGYVHTSDQAPDSCPVCYHPKSYFEEECANSSL